MFSVEQQLSIVSASCTQQPVVALWHNNTSLRVCYSINWTEILMLQTENRPFSLNYPPITAKFPLKNTMAAVIEEGFYSVLAGGSCKHFLSKCFSIEQTSSPSKTVSEKCFVSRDMQIIAMMIMMLVPVINRMQLITRYYYPYTSSIV